LFAPDALGSIFCRKKKILLAFVERNHLYQLGWSLTSGGEGSPLIEMAELLG